MLTLVEIQIQIKIVCVFTRLMGAMYCVFKCVSVYVYHSLYNVKLISLHNNIPICYGM